MAETATGTGRDEVGSSPLHRACREGDLQDVVDLLGRCDVEQVNAREGRDGPSPLDLASRHGHVDVMKALLDARADVNLANSEGTSLHAAVAGKQCAAIGVLVDAGGNIHAPSSRRSYQPIHLACEVGSLEVVETLLKYGADLEETAGYSRSRPINVAASHGNNDVVVALLAAGSPVDYNPDKYYELTPLQDAASGGHVAVARTLLANGANVNFGAVGCWTALHSAVGDNHADVVEVLMRAGADPEMPYGEDCETPLHRAVVALAHESAYALLKHGADVNAVNDFGDTPLHVAARWASEKEGSYRMLEILLRFGPDERALNNYDNTALRVAENSVDGFFDFETGQMVHETTDFLTLLRDSPADRRWRRRGLVILGRAFPWKLRIGDTGEEEVVEDAAGGIDTACPPASRQTGAGTASCNTAGRGRDGGAGGSGTAQPPALRQAGAGTAGITAVAVEGRDGDEGGGSETASADVGSSAVRALVSSVRTMREEYIFQKIVVLLLGVSAICFASLCRAFQWKGGNPGEGVGDAVGGSGTPSLPAPPQTEAGCTGGSTAAEGGRDGDEDGENETVSAAADFGAVVSSLLTMNEDDVFRKVVMFL